MTQGPHPAHVQSGRIAARVVREACEMIRPGVKIISICTQVERRIVELGGRPAFPCNVSINEVASHYTSPRNDPSTIPDFGLVKIDVGVHVDGYIADTARTVDIDGTLEGFIAATDEALDEAIRFIRPGVKLGDVGRVIERVIKDYGLKPVKELTGHSLKRYRLHAGKKVPNTRTRDSTVVEAGEYFAIEPFATTGSKIVDSKNVYIFINTGRKEPLKGVTEKLRLHLLEHYGSLPFASRWIGTSQKGIDVTQELSRLLKAKAIRGFPVLLEKGSRPVCQSEHTVFVGEDRTIVLTRPV